MNTKICPKCKKEFPISSFSKNPSKKDELNVYCRECQKEGFRDYYRRNKEKYAKHRDKWKKEFGEWYINLKKSKKCKKCGNAKWYVLDFHHRDTREKDSSVSWIMNNTASKSKVLEEISKCDVLCSNCHREFHHLEKTEGTLLEDFYSLDQ